MDYRIVYINAEAIFATVFVILYMLERSTRKAQMSKKLQALYILFTITIVLDSIWILVDGNPEYRMINLVVNLIYLSITSVIGYLWLLYVIDMFPIKNWVSNSRFILAIPVIIDICLVLTSPKTGWVYTIDAAGYYVRQPMHLISFGINYTYVLLGSYVALAARKEATMTADKRRLLVAAFFAIPIVVLTAIQLALPPGLPAMQGGIMISLLLVYATHQNLLVTRDPLTSLPNRYVFESDLMEKISDFEEGDHLYLMEGDLDNFKQINDTMGHPIGDRILEVTSEVLTDVFSPYASVIFRVGGDEFMMLVESEKDIDVDALTDNLNARLAEKGSSFKIDLSMSLGGVKYDGSMDFKTWINMVDAELYKDKSVHLKH